MNTNTCTPLLYGGPTGLIVDICRNKVIKLFIYVVDNETTTCYDVYIEVEVLMTRGCKLRVCATNVQIPINVGMYSIRN
jgi:hypothetical protein